MSSANLLSPEKYLKTKARQLPVHECLINFEWNRSRMADMIITRKHPNGSFTSGMFLVDLLCLGVKDCHYVFNQTPVEYEELKEKLNNRKK